MIFCLDIGVDLPINLSFMFMLLGPTKIVQISQDAVWSNATNAVLAQLVERGLHCPARWDRGRVGWSGGGGGADCF